MKRTQKIAPVQRVFSTREQDRARELGLARQDVDAAQRKLTELRQYRDDYARGFEEQARGGCGAARLRDYQTFLARLDLALRQQEQIVLQARQKLETHNQRWQSAARSARALDTVVDRWQGEERRQDDRREQIQTDERAQRQQGKAAAHPGDRQ